jgi:hypothetical protein
MNESYDEFVTNRNELEASNSLLEISKYMRAPISTNNNDVDDEANAIFSSEESGSENSESKASPRKSAIYLQKNYKASSNQVKSTGVMSFNTIGGSKKL